MSHPITSMALFCDFENIALGVRDAKYAKFDIDRVLEKLLLKGSIVVKKAYCDWDNYKEFKKPMHEAAFELIEIPHRGMTGKNSADIRLVVDALDLCYTKSHVDTFVIISGDSDFSPLVSKLRENNKTVIGVGVKSSTSDLLKSNCDEFVYYDDLVRQSEKKPSAQRRHAARPAAESQKDQPKSEKPEKAGKADKVAKPEKSEEERRQQGFDRLIDTIEALAQERDQDEKIWGSMIKQAIKRRDPGFNERYFGFRTFSEMLEEAQKQKLIELETDQKSGQYIIRRIVR